MVSTILILSPAFRELHEIAPLIFGLAGVAVFGILAWNYGPGVVILHAIMLLLSGLLALIIWHAGERAAIGDSSSSRETVLAVAAQHGEAKPLRDISQPARNPEFHRPNSQPRYIRCPPGQFREGMKMLTRVRSRVDDRTRINQTIASTR